MMLRPHYLHLISGQKDAGSEGGSMVPATLRMCDTNWGHGVSCASRGGVVQLFQLTDVEGMRRKG